MNGKIKSKIDIQAISDEKYHVCDWLWWKKNSDTPNIENNNWFGILLTVTRDNFPMNKVASCDKKNNRFKLDWGVSMKPPKFWVAVKCSKHLIQYFYENSVVCNSNGRWRSRKKKIIDKNNKGDSRKKKTWTMIDESTHTAHTYTHIKPTKKKKTVEMKRNCQICKIEWTDKGISMFLHLKLIFYANW